MRWEITYNNKHGQPGPLAYKLDTLIINQRIDEIGRPLPEAIRIGSLSDICRALGSHTNGGNIADIKRAFLQNAYTAIDAKIRGKKKNGKETWFEIGYTRYSVVFTGEKLPNGTEADAVYIILNPPYRELLNHVELRPLDYDYLKDLSPGAQRFYELLSFQIYGAISGNRPRAKMLYSEYCTYAPQTRYPDFDHVKKQMYKMHVPHRESVTSSRSITSKQPTLTATTIGRYSIRPDPRRLPNTGRSPVGSCRSPKQQRRLHLTRQDRQKQFRRALSWCKTLLNCFRNLRGVA